MKFTALTTIPRTTLVLADCAITKDEVDTPLIEMVPVEEDAVAAILVPNTLFSFTVATTFEVPDARLIAVALAIELLFAAE